MSEIIGSHRNQEQPQVAVVTADDRFVRWEDRRVVHRDQLVHRSVHIALFDGAGRLVIQRRHRGKLTYPGHWDLSASGHVEASDYPDPTRPDDDLDALYQRVAERELLEELGVTTALRRLGRFPPEPGVHYERIHLFAGASDGPFALQADEVEELLRVAKEELLARMADPDWPHTKVLAWFVAWAGAHGHWGAAGGVR
jgi:isopentenyldiphosphate isomerase